MDTHQLKAFVAVADLESVSRAAERLFLTQPAVTRRLQILEEQLGQPLFDRLGRRLLLTEAGRCLLPYARQILDLLDQSAQAVADLAATVQGSLILVTSHHIGLHRLPRVLREYKRLYPGVTLKLRFMNSREAHHAVRQGVADLGVTTEEDAVATDIIADTIWRDRLHVVVAPDHPLAAQTAAPRLGDLAPYSALLPDARFYTGRLVRELFQQHGVPLRIDADLSTDYLETLKALVAVGDSWSVLPATMLHDGALKILEVQDLHLERRLVAIRHAARRLSKAAEAFVALLRQQRD
ncbi:MAG: LysR family transcriptional regulator [Pseudomonadales bacterium]|jgi:DNA-binding transcriptional LysR family regulator|nr:LysR family transcriptional regulator [Pseudomonadales bacterium]